MLKKKFIISEFEIRNKSIKVLDEAIRDLAKGAPTCGKQKTLIIGIDGLSLSKVRNMIKNGKLPTFKHLIENGVSGNLRSTIPPDSLPAWTSFMTGKNPAKHGVTSHFKKVMGEDVVVNSTMIDSRRYWDIFTDVRLNSVVMNLPVTYPPQKIKGIMISDYLSSQGEIFTYPPQLCEKLTEIGYFTELATARFFDYDLTKPEPYIYKIEKTKEAAISIMKNYPWDMFTLGFISPDKAHHMLGMDGEAIDAVYARIDKVLAEIIGVIDCENTDIFIVSDHGSVNYEKEFALHSWLYQKGLLSMNSLKEQVDQPVGGKLLFKFLNFVYRLKVSLNLPSLPFFYFPKSVIESNKINLCPFDWGKTKVYSLLPPTSNFLPIFINTKGQRPFGTVEKGREYDQLVSFLLEELRNLCDPNTGEKIVKRIHDREEFFKGEFLSEMPDIIVELKGEYIGFSGYIDRSRIKCGPIFKKFKAPVIDHSIEGAFIFNGPKAKNNTIVEGMSILDMLPNILYVCQLPIPDDVDGSVKEEIFKEEFLKKSEIRIQKSVGKNNSNKEGWLKKHSTRDLESINQELRKLGYIR